MNLDRLDILRQMKSELGFDGPAEDEYTAKEIADIWGIEPDSVSRTLRRKKIPHTMREVMNNGSWMYVYKLERMK